MSKNTIIGLVIVALVMGASLSIIPHFLNRAYVPTTKRMIAVETPTGYVEVRLGGLRTFGSYSELFSYLNNIVKLRQVVSESFTKYYLLGRADVVTATWTGAPVLKAVSQTAPTAVTESRVSKTNVQVESVDEPDIAKTDGDVIAVSLERTVFIVDAREKKLLNRFELNSSIAGMFLADKKLVIISLGTVLYDYASPPTQIRLLPLVIPAGTPNTTIYLVDIKDPTKPEVKLKVSVTGSFLSARLANDSVYVLTTLPLGFALVPTVNGVPMAPSSIGVADEEPDAYTTIVAIDATRLSYTAYSFLTGSGSWVYMSPTKLYVGISKYFTTTTIYRMFLDVLAKYLPRDIATSIRNLLSAGAVAEALELAQKYLNSISDEEFDRLISLVNEDLSSVRFSEETKFYAFRLSGLSVEYSGSFSVDGVVLDQFSMEEMGSYFVVSTTSRLSSLRVYAYKEVREPTVKPIAIIEYRDNRVVNIKTYTPVSKPVETLPRSYFVAPVSVDDSENNVFVIDLRGFSKLGSLRGLARGERIYSARLIKSVLFLVTYRQVDPLFAIDLSDPANPRVLGYLKIPGFSEYLHPVFEDRLLGIGLEDNNLKLSLFDISNPAEMSEISKILIECSWSPVLSDHKAVTVDRDFSLIYLPVRSYCSYPPVGGLAVVSYGEKFLSFESLLEVGEVLRALYIGQELYVVSPNRLVAYTIPGLKYVAEVLLR